MAATPLQIAIQYHQAGELEQAERLYQALLAQNPQQADVLHLLGVLYGQRGQYENALRYVQQAITYDASQPTFYNSLGNIYKNLGDYPQAINAYQQALKLQPNYPSVQNNLGTLYYRQQDLIAAEKHFQKALQLKPDYADAWFNLGNVYLQRNDFKQAQNAFEKVLNLQPDYAAAHGQLGQLFQEQGELSLAQEHYEKHLELEPNHPEANYRFGTLLFKQGEFKTAAERFAKTLMLMPNHREALYNIAVTYLLLSQPNEALRYFMRLLPLKPEAEVYYNIGVILLHQDRLDDAIQYFNETLQHQADYLDAYLNLAAAYLKKLDYPNAIQSYQAAAKLKPNDPEINYLLAALTRQKAPESAPAIYLEHLFDEYAPYFDSHLQQQLHYQVPELLYQTVITKLGNTMATWRIMDLGCGTGLAGAKFRPLAQTLIGVDLSSRMVAIAKQKNIYDELIVGDLLTALPQQSHLNLIIAADVFNYIGNLTDIFKAAYQALTEDGWFIFTVEKGSQFPYELQNSARYAHHQDYISQLAEQTGFKIESIELAQLRIQQNLPVEGYVILLSKPRAH